MRATIINTIGELDAVKTKAVVFAFRPSMKHILQVTAKTRIKVVQIPPSSKKSLAGAAMELLIQKKIKCLTGSIQGIRRDKHGSIVEIEVKDEISS